VGDYKDLINYEYFGPRKHPKMSIYDRSAQFAPFSALNGYSDEVKETARLTDSKIELDEDEKEQINEKLLKLDNNQEVELVYFVKDNKKTGGKYLNKVGIIKRIDYIKKTIIFTDKSVIPIDNIINVK
jgi:hypothetical protein